MDPETEILGRLRAGGFLGAGPARLTPLTGGVSSDVFRLEHAAGVVCVKRAVPALRVAQEWLVPQERNHSEVEYLRVARRLAGAAVPEVLYEDPAAHLFVMSFYPPGDHPVWKAELAAGRAGPAFAGQVGALLAGIHAGAAAEPALAAAFANDTLFEDLRLSPYLRWTARAHPDLAGVLTRLAETTAATRVTLVHGDVSPKNILVGPQGPVLLDAECAWWGDPAFDMAFCSTHLLLKGLWQPTHRAAYGACLDAFAGAYLAGVTFEGVEARAAALTGGLLLARADGKSPVEYLDEAGREVARRAARALLAEPPQTLAELADRWSRTTL